MFKLLRKYNKWIMVVGGVLLMVAFLLPQALNQFSGTGPRSTVARYEGGRVSGTDYRRATQELQLLQEVTNGAALRAAQVEGPDHWILLTLEARRMGLMGGPEDGVSFLAELAPQIAAPGVPPESMLAFLQSKRDEQINSGSSASFVDHALAKLRAVLRLRELASPGGPTVSRPEAVAAASTSFDQALTDMVSIEATDDPSMLSEPVTDEAVRAHYEKYKDTAPGENEFGVGYQRPPSVRLEYLKIDAGAVAPLIGVDDLKLEAFYRQNTRAYNNDKVANRDRLVGDYQRARAKELVSKAVEAASRALARSRTDVKSDGIYRELPADWAAKSISMEQLAEIARAELPTPTPESGPVVQVYPDNGTFRSQQMLSQLPGGIALARPTTQFQNVSFPQLVMGVRELAGASQLPLQQGLTFGPLADGLGDAYFFRVLGVRPTSPPDSFEEVADQAKADAIKLLNFDRLTSASSMNSLRQEAVANGLDALSSIPGSRRFNDVTVTRSSVSKAPPDPRLGKIASEPVRDAVMGLTADWAPTTLASELPRDQRTAVAPSAASLSVVVAVVKAWRPMTIEQFRAQMRNVNQEIAKVLVPADMAAMTDPLSYASLKARFNYRPAHAAASSEDEDEDEREDPNGKVG